VKKVFFEALLVAVAGAAFAFAANALSSRGLALTRNYFPGNSRPALPSNGSAVHPGTTNASQSSAVAVTEHLHKQGLQVVDGNEALQLFHDPGFEQGSIIFIDARSDAEHYRKGHIPGAYQFDRIHPENSLAVVLPACQAAQKIVVYCDGGDCEESEFAALSLRNEMKVPGEKLFVYTGGINEWNQRGSPVEQGERKSGQIHSTTK